MLGWATSLLRDACDRRDLCAPCRVTHTRARTPAHPHTHTHTHTHTQRGSEEERRTAALMVSTDGDGIPTSGSGSGFIVLPLSLSSTLLQRALSPSGCREVPCSVLELSSFTGGDRRDPPIADLPHPAAIDPAWACNVQAREGERTTTSTIRIITLESVNQPSQRRRAPSPEPSLLDRDSCTAVRMQSRAVAASSSTN